MMESQGLDLPSYFKQGKTWTDTWYNSFHNVGHQVLQDPGHRHGRPSCTPALVSRLQQSRGSRGAHRRTEGRWQRWAQGDQEARGHRADGLGKGRSRWSSETGSSAPSSVPQEDWSVHVFEGNTWGYPKDLREQFPEPSEAGVSALSSQLGWKFS